MNTYRVSALAFGLVRMWRGWSVIVPVVTVNAALQALLIWPNPDVDQWLAVIGLALLSAVAFMLAYGLVGATALKVTEGSVTWRQAMAVLRTNGVRYAIWALILLVVTMAGLAIYAVPGFVILAITPFVLLAALDGRPNPLAANFHAMGQRFWRWLVVVIITGAVIGIGSFAVALTNFFVRGLAASFVAWLVAGLVLAWFTTTWALIYRSTSVADP